MQFLAKIKIIYFIKNTMFDSINNDKDNKLGYF